MRAVLLDAFGDVSHFRPAEIERPRPRAGQVLVRVAASGVNPIDCKIRTLAPAFAPRLPAVLGMDLAGVVEEAGGGVTDFRPGDEVFGCVGGLGDLPGTLAEYVAADQELLAPKPANLSLRQAAALPLVGITAWEALHDKAAVRAGQHALIHGGAGGVGHVAVQLAKAAGLRVAATVSSEAKAATARDLGADEIVNYRQEQVADYVERLTGGVGFDLVLDTVGGANLDASFAAARPEGQVVSTNTRSAHDLSILHAKALSLHVVFMLLPLITGRDRARFGRILRQVARLVQAGELRPLLDERRFTLDSAAQAHALVEQGQARGKVVVDIA
jgi:NADPH2:quinone reductase